MPSCPDHARELVPTGGERVCPFCRGSLLDSGAFSVLAGAVQVSPESRADAACLTRVRVCPDCRVPMPNWRIAKLEAWVERCPQCEGVWVEPADRRTLENLARRAARETAWSSLPAREREEIAAALAAEHVPEGPVVSTLSAGETVQAVVGMPVISGAKGEGAPMVTIALICAAACFFAMGRLDPEGWGFEALAWRPFHGLSLDLFTAMWAHAGWPHVLGNLFFFWAFGSAVERRERHGLLLGVFLATGVATTWLQGLASSPETYIGGASGAVFAVMGLAAVLQPKAKLKVTVRPLLLLPSAMAVPLWLGLAGYFVLQVVLWQVGVEGVGFLAHLSGLVLGVLAGLAVRQR